jgi:hypothetical protein
MGLITNTNRNYTTGNTENSAKKFSKSLQVKKLRIMFVSDSKQP